MNLKLLPPALLLILASNVYANDDCLYLYKAHVTDVYDADTITVDVDLGFHTWIKGERIRLSRIDAPEVRGKEKVEGKLARDWLREKILGKEILLRTIKSKKGKDSKGKFGRYLGEVILNDVNMNDELVKVGHAEYRDY
jgi:micrococcal nuclease